MRSLSNSNVDTGQSALHVEGEDTDTHSIAVHADPQLNDFAIRETPVIESQQVGTLEVDEIIIGKGRWRGTDDGMAADTKVAGEWDQVTSFP